MINFDQIIEPDLNPDILQVKTFPSSQFYLEEYASTQEKFPFLLLSVTEGAVNTE